MKMNNNYEISISSPVNSLQDYYLIFQINDKKYAINIKNIIEVIKLEQIHIPENTPLGIIGYINYNNKSLNVIDLYSLLGFEIPKLSVNNQLIIISFEDEFFTINTDKIFTVKYIPNSDIEPFPYESDYSLVKEIYNNQDDSVHIINIANVKKLIELNKSKAIYKNYSDLLPTDEKSLKILQVRSDLNNKHNNSFSFPIHYNSTNQYILFKLSEHNYYLDLKYVKEFVSLKRLNITKLPYTKEFIKGLINIKGDFLVVIDLKNFLNDEKTEIKEGSKIIITQGKNFNIAFLVDEIKYIKNLKDIPNLNYNYNNEYISYEFTEENELYSIINYEKIINDEKIYINQS